MELKEAKELLGLVRLCEGSQRIVHTSHRNETLNGDYAALNKNIKINIAKLKDGISNAKETNKNKEG